MICFTLHAKNDGDVRRYRHSSQVQNLRFPLSLSRFAWAPPTALQNIFTSLTIISYFHWVWSLCSQNLLYLLQSLKKKSSCPRYSIKSHQDIKWTDNWKFLEYLKLDLETIIILREQRILKWLYDYLFESVTQTSIKCL